jgi:hypothetical protein
MRFSGVGVFRSGLEDVPQFSGSGLGFGGHAGNIEKILGGFNMDFK